MKALSIMQPWAHLIASGQKDIENRSWPTRYRGVFLIHAGKKRDTDFDAGDFSGLILDIPELLDVGGIVGEAEIVDCVTDSPSTWYFGMFGFVIRNARPLPFRPCRGALGFFEPDFTPAPAKVAPPARQATFL